MNASTTTSLVSAEVMASMDESGLIQPEPVLTVELTEEEEEEQMQVRWEIIRAIRHKDMEKLAKLQRKMIMSSSILKVLKELMGANYIRKQGYDTRDADLAFGPGWLDEDDGGPFYDENGKLRRIDPWTFKKHFLNKPCR